MPKRLLIMNLLLLAFFTACQSPTTEGEIESVATLPPTSVLATAAVETPTTVPTTAPSPVPTAELNEMPGEEGMEEVMVNQSFQLPVGETAVIPSESLKLTFDTVLTDSRCPTDVDCVWSGEATLSLTVQMGDQAAETITLSTLSDSNSVSYKTVTIQLEELEPYPQTTEPIAPDAYIATVIVTK